MLPFIFQFTRNQRPKTNLANKKARTILNLINRRDQELSTQSKDDLITNTNFDNVKIQKKNDHIYYIGQVTCSITVIGFIDFEGKGEEVYIQKNAKQDSKKHKILMYKTTIDHNNQHHDYFTKHTIKTLIRTRMS